MSGGLHLPLYSLQTDSTDQWAEVWRDSQLSAASASLAPLLALEHIPHLVDDAERERILRKLPEQVIEIFGINIITYPRYFYASCSKISLL